LRGLAIPKRRTSSGPPLVGNTVDSFYAVESGITTVARDPPLWDLPSSDIEPNHEQI